MITELIWRDKQWLVNSKYCIHSVVMLLQGRRGLQSYCIHSVFRMIRASQLNTMPIADHAGGDEEE